MAKLTIVSIKNDKLELEIEDSQRVSIEIGALKINELYHPWHSQWKNLKITKFLEPLDKVKEKIVKFYELEKSYNIRKPGYATICFERELFTIGSCKILNCEISETEISLELVIDDVEYVSSFDRNINCDKSRKS